MACDLKPVEGVKAAADCKCYSAVMRTYKCMHSDEPPQVAMEAAVRVYRFHHPEDCPTVARLTVESWVHEGRCH